MVLCLRKLLRNIHQIFVSHGYCLSRPCSQRRVAASAYRIHKVLLKAKNCHTRYTIKPAPCILKLRAIAQASRLLMIYRSVSSRNSSFVKPASAIIPINSPRLISSCLGTGTMTSSLARIKWLPFCQNNLKAGFSNSLNNFLPREKRELRQLLQPFQP